MKCEAEEGDLVDVVLPSGLWMRARVLKVEINWNDDCKVLIQGPDGELWISTGDWKPSSLP